MTRETEETPQRAESLEQEGYQAPGVEAVLTPEDLEREVLYGGLGSPILCPP